MACNLRLIDVIEGLHNPSLHKFAATKMLE
jgi:hypothetical protein